MDDSQTLDELLNSPAFMQELDQAEYMPDYTGADMDTLADNGRYPEL